MLDLLSRAKNLIVIYTTEKKPEEMAYNTSNNSYQASFFRNGRVNSMFEFYQSNGDFNHPQYNAREEHIYAWKNREILPQ